MAAEVFAFSAAFDHAFIIRHDLQFILNQKLSMMNLFDSKQFVDIVMKGSHPTEKIVMIEAMAT